MVPAVVAVTEIESFAVSRRVVTPVASFGVTVAV